MTGSESVPTDAWGPPASLGPSMASLLLAGPFPGRGPSLAAGLRAVLCSRRNARLDECPGKHGNAGAASADRAGAAPAAVP